MKKCLVALAFISVSLPLGAQQEYKIPPSQRSLLSVPVISDEKMEQCVKLYNEGLWLGEKLESLDIDLYSQADVDAYNEKVSHHSGLIDQFNRECAGKQSRSASEAAQKLNQEQGLSVQECDFFE